MKKQEIQQNILSELINKGGFEWNELVDAINKENAAPKNWMKVRSLLQYQINIGKISRVSDIHSEKYITN